MALKIDTSDPRLNSIVRAVLDQDFTGSDRVQWEGNIVRELWQREDRATMIRIHVTSGQSNQIYWIKDWNGKTPERAEAEITALLELQESFASKPRLFVPRLVVSDLVQGYVVTENFGKSSFYSELLWSSMLPGRCSTLSTWTDDIVDWLCCLQSNSERGNHDGRIDMESPDSRFSRQLTFCSEHGFLSGRIFDSLGRIYEYLRSTVGDSDFRTVRVHGDFDPTNVHVDRNGVCVIDFELYSYGPAYSDVARMWAALWAKSLHHVLGKICLGGLAERFVGKSLEKLRLDTQSLQLGMLQALLQKTYLGLKVYRSKQHSLAPRLQHLTRAYCYRHMLARMLKDM